MSHSVQPHRRQPTRLPHPWDSLGKNTGVGCHFLLQWMKVKSESEVAQSGWLLHNKALPRYLSIHICLSVYDPITTISIILDWWEEIGGSSMCDFCFLAFPTGWKLTDPWFLYDCKEIFLLFWRKEGSSVFQTEKTRGKIKKRLNQSWIYHLLSCCMQSTPCKMPVWMKHKLESRFPGEISITSDMQMIPPLCRKRRGTKEPFDESEREEWKSWLKTKYSEN